MDANGREYLNRLAEQVVGATYEVANTLGPGFLEKVYERAPLKKSRGEDSRFRPKYPSALATRESSLVTTAQACLLMTD